MKVERSEHVTERTKSVSMGHSSPLLSGNLFYLHISHNLLPVSKYVDPWPTVTMLWMAAIENVRPYRRKSGKIEVTKAEIHDLLWN